MAKFLFSCFLWLSVHSFCLETSDALQTKLMNITELEQIVQSSQGPSEVLAITNGGDGPIVEQTFRDLSKQLFRADGQTTLMVQEEVVRRGQFFGLLDAIRALRASGRALDPHKVSVGIMIPGKGTRMSPATQRLFGIKPFMEMLIRCHTRGGGCGPWLSGASASLYSWTLVAYHLERMGFRGMAWKWGDEPQIPATKLSDLQYDLSQTDAVRFASELIVDEDLAKNKEWFARDPKTGLMIQIHRRDKAELLDVMTSFGVDVSGDEPKALGHIGSPAFSYLFLEEAEKIFGSYSTGWMDVDGYIFETMTQPKDLWELDLARDRQKSEIETRKAREKDPHAKSIYVGLDEVVHLFPNFYAEVQKLKSNIETRRGHAFVFQVIDFGDQLYWGDIGQLQKARRSMHEVQEISPQGDMARKLAAIEDVMPDRFGNRVVGHSIVPQDGSVKNSVVIDTQLFGKSNIEGAVLVNSQLGEAVLQEGSVVFGSTVGALSMGKNGYSYMSIADRLDIPENFIHTSIPHDPERLDTGVEDWWAPADGMYNPGKGLNYSTPQMFHVGGNVFKNPMSFEAKFAQMRQRKVKPRDIETQIDEQFREPIRARLIMGVK